MKIIIEVDDSEFDFTGCTIWPLSDDTCGYGWDVDTSAVTYQGKKEGDGWEFFNEEDPADYMIDLYRDTH